MSGTDQEEMEQRLRHTLQAVAELPRGVPHGPDRPEPLRWPRQAGPRVRRRGAVAVVVSLAAVAAVVSLLVVYGPHTTDSPPRRPPTPAGRPRSSTPPASTTPATTAPTPTTATTPTTTPGASATTTPTTAPPAIVGTEQVTYEPFTGTHVDPSLHVTGEQSGACYEYGGGVDGRDYYRCGTVQPCFAGPEGTSSPLVCPQDPVTAGNVVMWDATSVAANQVPATTRTPWAMQLSDGEVCTLVNAAWSGLGPFACTGTTFADCHEPQAATPTWSAECQAQESATSPFSPTTVERVWF